MNHSTNGPQTALQHIIGLCGWDFATLTAEKKRRHFKTLKSAMVQWMLSTRIADFTSDVGFMAYNVAIFTDASHAAHFAGGVLPAPPRPVQPANPTAPQVAAHNQLVKVFEAYRNSHQELKYMMEHFFMPDIAHLRDETTMFHNVQPRQMFAAAHDAHGKLLAYDLSRMNDATKEPPDRLLTPEENIVVKQARFKALADQGIAHAINDGVQLQEYSTYISQMAPACDEMVKEYYRTTDADLRTSAALVTHVKEALKRLPTQPLLSSFTADFCATTQRYLFVTVAASAMSAIAHEEDNTDGTAYAITDTANPPKGGGGHVSKHKPTAKPKTLAEFQAFYDNIPNAKYCFVHGSGNHSGPAYGTFKGCKFLHDPANGFTDAQKACTGPKFDKNGKVKMVGNALPSIKQQHGFHHAF
jgi:hypothetical protein